MTTRNKQGSDRRRRLFLVNRLLIILSVGAILAGLTLNHWQEVLVNALVLCYSCIGLGQ